jgi:hypothetical protein
MVDPRKNCSSWLGLVADLIDNQSVQVLPFQNIDIVNMTFGWQSSRQVTSLQLVEYE